MDNLTELHRIENKKRMLSALSKHMGVVLYATRDTGISRRTHYVWMHEDAEYREQVERINEECFDFVERKILEAVNEKQPAVMIFYAKTRMRKRGYQERHEIANPTNEEFRIAGNMTIEETKRELPPEAIQSIVSNIIKDAPKAEAALRKLAES
jgi:predicted amidophosphoribosyltransferase